MGRIKVFLLSFIISVFLVNPAHAEESGRVVPVEKGRAVMESPDGKIRAAFYADEGGCLTYELSRDGRIIIEPSSLGITVDMQDMGSDVKLPESIRVSTITEEYKTRGNHSMAHNHCHSATIPLIHEPTDTTWQIEVRVFNDGLAWRYVIPGMLHRSVSGEATSFRIPRGSIAFFQKNTRNYEGIYRRKRVERINCIFGMPVTIKLPEEHGYLAITEAGVYGWSGMTLRADGDRTFRAVFEDDDSWLVKADADSFVRSPWRIVMVAGTLNDLVNCDLVNNVSPRPPEDLFAAADEWIKPGRALWSWWSEGTGDQERQKQYAIAAGRLGFEYILVDAGWEDWQDNGKDHWSMLKELVEYSEAKDVKVWVWKSWKKMADEGYRNDYFRRVKEAGAVGVKIDYMDSECRDMIEFYESALRDAARHKLMVNFHGANKPTGEARTYPNETTREGIRGLEYNRFGIPLSPAYNATIPFTRFIAGHGDYTPVTFNKKKLGRTSFAHQLAMPIVFLSPLTHYGANPENLLDNPKTSPALDVLRSIPTVWDETIVLKGSEIRECAAFARRSGHTWFIGILNGKNKKAMKIELSFLQKGNYKATILADSTDRKDEFTRSEKTVDAASELVARMGRGGGFVAVLEPHQAQ